MASLPSYVAAAKPVPLGSRAPWYKSTAQTYAGIMLWFVFWHEVPVGSVLQQGKPYSRVCRRNAWHTAWESRSWA